MTTQTEHGKIRKRASLYRKPKRAIMSKNHSLVQECIELYGLKTVKDLAEKTGIPYTTLNPWNNKGPSQIGELLLNALIDNAKLRQSINVIIEADEARAEAITLIKNNYKKIGE